MAFIKRFHDVCMTWAQKPLKRMWEHAFGQQLARSHHLCTSHPPLPHQSISMGLGFGSGSAGRDDAQTTGSAGPLSGPQPLLTLAMAKDEVKARLAPIPVYTVANPKNEFVLVAGEVSCGLVERCEWLHCM